MMRGLRKLALMELKLFLREPESFFSTLILPLIMLFMFGSIFGNDPEKFHSGHGFVDASVPAYMGIVIAMIGLVSIPISVATDREKGILRRLRTTPLRPQTILVAWVVMYSVIALAGSLLLVVAGKAVYKVRFDGNAIYVFLAFTLCIFSFFSLGFLLASLARSGRSANIIGMVILFPMMFLSGATFPWQVLPDSVKMVARALPLTYVVRLLQGLWFGEPWSQHLTEVAVLAGMLVVGVLISTKIFRWE